MSGRVLCAIGALAAAMTVAQSASAWCRTTTCDPTDRKQDCLQQGNCIVSGLPLFWPSDCVSFVVQQDGTPRRNIPFEVALEVVSDGFRAWLNADCGGGVHPSFQMATHNGGRAACNEQQYNEDAPNANVWMFRDDRWPYTDLGSHTLALTTVTFNVDNGEIFDVDVEINSVQNELTLDVGAVKNDLPSIVTHEAGHFLGLSHSDVDEATMFQSYRAGSTNLRSLHVDDTAGICATYPPDRQPRTHSCEPRRGFISECAGPESDEAGCSCTTPGGSRAMGASALTALALLSFVTRRRRISAGRRRNDDKKAGHGPGPRD